MVTMIITLDMGGQRPEIGSNWSMTSPYLQCCIHIININATQGKHTIIKLPYHMLKLPAMVYNLKIGMIGMQKIGMKFRKNSKHWLQWQISPHMAVYTNCTNLKMEPNYLTKSDVQLKSNISRTKNDKRVLQKVLESWCLAIVMRYHVSNKFLKSS